MFFPERIQSISKNDLVLEIGPGATPHPRSNVLLEKEYETEQERLAQSAHVGILQTDKEITYYSGGKFPFKDNEFDYVICSHVLEHVEDVDQFLKEVFRVSSKGYLEFPTIYYDYLHNIEEHLNMLLYKDHKIYWCKKTETPIPNLVAFTNFFRKLQRMGYRYQSDINNLWHQGFEWSKPLENIKVNNWEELTYSQEELENKIEAPRPQSNFNQIGIKHALKLLLVAIKNKLTK